MSDRVTHYLKVSLLDPEAENYDADALTRFIREEAPQFHEKYASGFPRMTTTYGYLLSVNGGKNLHRLNHETPSTILSGFAKEGGVATTHGGRCIEIVLSTGLVSIGTRNGSRLSILVYRTLKNLGR